MPKLDLTKDELELINECIYQAVCHDDDLLAEYRKSHNMTDDDCDKLTIALREKLNLLIQREYHIY